MTGHPGLLIFDDSMSALDFATDLRLRKNLAEKYRDSTLILISQRASTLKNADNIIVLEEGRCTGFANHEKLLETNQAYKEIYDTQIMTN
jgi:ATP-binding cassette subfamily B protein